MEDFQQLCTWQWVLLNGVLSQLPSLPPAAWAAPTEPWAEGSAEMQNVSCVFPSHPQVLVPIPYWFSARISKTKCSDYGRGFQSTDSK